MDLQSRTDRTFLNEDQRWIAGPGVADLAVCDTITIDRSAFDFVTAFPNGFLPSGVTLGKITATGLYGPYNNVAVDGRETAVGFLAVTVVVAPEGAATSDIVAALYWRGVVIESLLPTGHGLDAAGKTDLAGRVRFI